MPYKTIWVEPEVFLEHNGVTVYHTYRDDDIDQGANWFLFTLREDGGEDKDAFDIRDVDPLNLYKSGLDETRRAVLRHAIDNGLLKAWEGGQ